MNSSCHGLHICYRLHVAFRYLYLVRHGQYHTRRGAGRYGELTALGRRQADRIGKCLVQFPIDSIVHSDLSRAAQTTSRIANFFPEVPVRSSKLLREGVPTPPAGWDEDPDPQQLEITRQRMDTAFARHFKATRGRDRHELIVAHGNLIRYFVRKALGDSVDKWWRMDIAHCSLTLICVGPPPRDGLLLRFNEIGHLSHKMQTRA